MAPEAAIPIPGRIDPRPTAHAKLREWRDNGVRLGWLILPDQRQVWHYAPEVEPVCLDDSPELRDAALLPGLALPLEEFGSRGHNCRQAIPESAWLRFPKDQRR